jgi:hypothetical protein
MRSSLGRAIGLLLVGALVFVGEAAAAEPPRLFELLVSRANPFAPLAPYESFSDVTTLSDGRIVALPDCCGGKRLYEVDVQGRSNVLRSTLYFEVDERNAIIESRDGALLFSERGRVLRRAPDGATTVVAGTPRPRRASGDGGPAIGAGMEPTGLAQLPDGSLLIADARNHRIRRVDTAGRISTVAGTGVAGNDGDRGPAVHARLTSPEALSAYADGSYLIAHGTRQIRVRRVGANGTISTVAGGGAQRGLNEPCPRRPRSATSLYISADGFGDITALAGGGFLITSFAGLLKVSPQGTVVALMCSPFGPRYRPDGRDIYAAGRTMASAFLPSDGYGAPDVAQDSDGTIVLDAAFRDSALALIATPGLARRLTVALTPGTLSTVHRGKVIVASTAAAAVELGVYRRGRLVARVDGHIGVGKTVLELPHRLRPGINSIRLSARAQDGRRAWHSLRVLGTGTVPMRLAKHLIREHFYFSEVGEGEGYVRLSVCRRSDRRNVRCRARGEANGSQFRGTYRIHLRRNGVVMLVQNAAGRHGRYALAVDL